MSRQLRVGDTVVSYYFFSERKGEIVDFQRDRHNEVLERCGMKLKDLAGIKWEDNPENIEWMDEDSIHTEKPEKGWNGHGTYLEEIMR